MATEIWLLFVIFIAWNSEALIKIVHFIRVSNLQGFQLIIFIYTLMYIMDLCICGTLCEMHVWLYIQSLWIHAKNEGLLLVLWRYNSVLKRYCTWVAYTSWTCVTSAPAFILINIESNDFLDGLYKINMNLY